MSLKVPSLKIYIKVILGWQCSQEAVIEQRVWFLNPGIKEFSQVHFQGTGTQHEKSQNI